MRITVISGNTIGGTEKAAVLFACELSKRGHAVEMLTDPSGPRTASLQEAGVTIKQVGMREDDLVEYLRFAKPDIIHQHVSGYWKENPLYAALSRIEDPKPKLIETNVFGRMEDPAGKLWIERRFFVSAASGCQAFLRSGQKMSDDALKTNLVLYNPLQKNASITAEERSLLRRELGLGQGETLVIRVGQPGKKWRDWELRAVQMARRRGHPVKLLVMEPPASISKKIRSGTYGDGIIIKPATSDFQFIANLYQASDLMIHASDWGESYGYTIAEGMLAGLPVITISTPWGDNAQVELVENGDSGFVCASVPEMARRLDDLIVDPGLRQKMGESARRRIESISLLATETDVLEDVLRELSSGETSSRLNDRRQYLALFFKHFHDREHHFSEPAWLHPLDRFAAEAYATYRCLRSSVGQKLKNR